MQIFIKRLTGQTIVVVVGEFDTVDEIKVKIENSLGVPTN
jgi:hypothetical protein